MVIREEKEKNFISRVISRSRFLLQSDSSEAFMRKSPKGPLVIGHTGP